MNLNSSITPEELKVFLAEADEQIELLNEDIVRLEKEEENPELLNEIFRAAHTLKGSSAMVGHQTMAELTHVMESLLDKLRSKELSVSTEMIDVLLYSVDILKVLKNEIATGEKSDLDVSPALDRLKAVTVEKKSPAPVEELVLTPRPEVRERLKAALIRGESLYRLEVLIDKNSEWASVRCLQCLNELSLVGEVIASVPSAEEINEDKVGFTLSLILTSHEDKDAIQGVATSIAEIVSVKVSPYTLEEDAAASKKPAPDRNETTDQGNEPADKVPKETGASVQSDGSPAFQSVRIDVKILDNLMNIVEELVIDRSRISRVGKMLAAKYLDDELIDELSGTSNHIIKIINELQQNIMKVRMVPIGTIFSRFPRMVRDLAQKQQKKLDFIVEGEETELDRSIIERIRDPLVHLLRNAVDHGIESPEQREAANKPQKAVIRLTARHEQNNIVISVKDDGGGIDVNKVKESVLRKRLISAEVLETLTDVEAINLIFMPGISTTEKATEVSGRGVGLDIVRSNVESLGGSVSLETRIGQGSEFTIRLPLTVAIIQGLFVSSVGRIYVMPLVSIIETVTIEPSEIHAIGGKEVIRRRDSIIPLLRLDKVFGSKSVPLADKDKNLVVIVKAGNRLAGIIVDALMERQEIVVKPLGEYLGNAEGIAGATILGDGQVSLILDVPSLVKMAIAKSDRVGSILLSD